MTDPASNRFIQIEDATREINPWTHNEWLCRPDLVNAEKLLLVRANMAPGHCHPFHYHPHREEIIYVLYGRAEQWVGEEKRILSAGEMAHIPAGTIHGTYNPHHEPLVFLAIHGYTQYFETFGAEPMSLLIAGLVLVGLAIGVARLVRRGELKPDG
jgi:quercetin dioxygenase-like cupin family protein